MTPPIEFELLGRADCSLCHELRAELEAALAARGAEARIIDRDIATDAELERRFGWHIPVLRSGGVVVCIHHLDLEQLARVLDGRPWQAPELR